MKPQQTCKCGENGRCKESPEGSQGKILLIPDDRKVIIRDIECHSEEVYSYLEAAGAQQDPVDALLRALECGVAVLQRVSSRSDNDYMAKLATDTFYKMEESVKGFIEKNLDPSLQGSLAKRIHETFLVQFSQVKETINKGEANVADFQKQLSAFVQSLQNTIQASVGTAMSSDQTAISILLREVKTEVQALRDAMVSKATENMTSPPVKGENYEEEILALINKWAGAFQNTVANVIVDDVRSVSGPLGKAGDAVVRLITNGESRICVEMKTQERISANRILEVCRAAKENRAADMVIYVADDPANLPAEFSSWTQFDDVIITSTAGFQIALRIAASKLLLQKAQSSSTGIDVERGLSLLQEIDSRLKKFGVLLSCTRATIKNSEKAQQMAIEIRDGIEDASEKLVALLSGQENENTKEAV
jgi:hypothetical protein